MPVVEAGEDDDRSKKNGSEVHHRRRDAILTEASILINGSRSVQYGDFGEQVERMRHLMHGMTGKKPDRETVHAFFFALKLSRMKGGVWSRDTLTDLCGYAALIGEDQ